MSAAAAMLAGAALLCCTVRASPGEIADGDVEPDGLYLNWLDRVLVADLSRAGSVQPETFVLMEQFKALLDRKSVERDQTGNTVEIPKTALADKLQTPARPLPGWEFNLRDEEGFDVKRLLPKLKADARTEDGSRCRAEGRDQEGSPDVHR